MHVTVEPQKIFDILDPKRAKKGQNGATVPMLFLFGGKFDPNAPNNSENKSWLLLRFLISLFVTEK